MRRALLTVACAISWSTALAPAQAVRECAACHPAQANPHPSTSMAHAMERAGNSGILHDNALLTFSEGAFRYRIEREGDRSVYTVSDGKTSLSAPIEWAFGLGRAGQTYVFLLHGEMHESRVSYYDEIKALDLTIGAVNRKPGTLLEAIGEPLAGDDGKRCFNCHATNAVRGSQFTLAALTPGVQCERCHGETETHLAAVKGGGSRAAPKPSLKTMSAEETSNFSGQCHRTWEEIAGGPKLGVFNVRFQPYRLTNSKCYDADDKRISCVGCHDPHRELDRVDAHYDRQCQACHSGANAKAAVCKLSQTNCVSCHMPKIEMPGSHYKFTDHEIRIVRANARYPD